jgi:hypothetical protein
MRGWVGGSFLLSLGIVLCSCGGGDEGGATGTGASAGGSGPPASCTSAAGVAAVAKGGIIPFDRGPDPITMP